MISFKEYINEAKISKGSGMKYLNIIKKYLNSKTMDIKTEGNTTTVRYDFISLIFKDLFLVGFEEDNEYYAVSRKLKSIKDLKNVKEFNKMFGSKIDSIKKLEAPKELTLAYFPENLGELKKLVNLLISKRGSNSVLNDIDVSNVTDMNSLFFDSKFNGDISKWDVSNVTDMSYMFQDSKFNGDLSKWDVSNVTDMRYMFGYSNFNGDVSKWDVSRVRDMNTMFGHSKFNGNVSKWDVSNATDTSFMFDGSALEKNEPDWLQSV